jgi:hypothetical protein
MRQDTATLNLEHLKSLAKPAGLKRSIQQNVLPNLNGVDVYALGVDGAGKSLAYWTALRDFWTAYFQKTGAALRRYFVLREPSDVGR